MLARTNSHKYVVISGNQQKSHHPAEPCNIFHGENVAITMSYFSVGLAMSLISTPLNVYMVKTLNVEPQMQITIGILRFLPWSMKLLFGFLSDAVPIFGMHRKPYLIIGAVLYSFVFIFYSMIATHSIQFLAICVFLSTLGIIQMDVIADTMCVERSRFEPEDLRGQMQASFYTIRFAGNLLGAILGGVLCNAETFGWGLTFFQITFMNGFIPLILVSPWIWGLREKFHLEADVSSANASQMEDEQRSVGDSLVAGCTVHSALPMVDLIRAGRSTSPLPAPPPPPLPRILPTGKIAANESFYQLHSALKTQYFAVSDVEQQREKRVGSLLSASVASTDTLGWEGESYQHSADKEETASPGVQDDVEHPTCVSVRHQLHQIWQTVQLRSVWRPMAFIYIYNLLQVPNVAWQSYLQLTLHFPAWILGLTVVLGSAMTFAGTLAYKFAFYKSTWRSIYLYTTLLTTFFSLLQLVLIFQINTRYLHLNNYLFSLGDDVISSYIAGIQFLPICAMYMRLCPAGSEGASYAMLTTFANMGLICSYNVGSSLSGLWDVSNDAMRRGDVSGLWKLSALTSLVAVLPLSLLFLLPRDNGAQTDMAKSQERSKLGGALFLGVLGGSLLWTVASAFMRLQEIS